MNSDFFLSTFLSEYNLDGCYHVFVDAGSNIGVQIRKLYEPQKYPGAKFNSFFKEAFGEHVAGRKDICAIGFEPNPAHASTLKGERNLFLILHKFKFIPISFRIGEKLSEMWTSSVFLD